MNGLKMNIEIKILNLLKEVEQKSVKQIVDIIGADYSAVSACLKKLYEEGKVTRIGPGARWGYYYTLSEKEKEELKLKGTQEKIEF